MLSIYSNHNRELLFHGPIDDPRIVLLPDTREVSLDGTRRKVVNSSTQPGWLGLWVASL
jgi:hypothetical protein